MYAAVDAKMTQDTKTKQIIETASNKFIEFLCECLKKYQQCNIPVNKTKIGGNEKLFRKLLSYQSSLKQIRQILGKEKEFVKCVGSFCYRFLKVP